MVMPQPFTTTPPQLINYDYSDIASGTGYETYYLIESEDSSGKDYHLVSQRDYSNSVAMVVTLSSTEDHDFDLTAFAIPMTIGGTALLSVPMSGNGDLAIHATIYKWNGTSEVAVSSEISSLHKTGVKMFFIEIPIPNTHFSAGETLRLRMRVDNSDGFNNARYGIDPADRTDANLTITTTSKIYIPYKLDL